MATRNNGGVVEVNGLSNKSMERGGNSDFLINLVFLPLACVLPVSASLISIVRRFLVLWEIIL
jgi:hypothetical protein